MAQPISLKLLSQWFEKLDTIFADDQLALKLRVDLHAVFSLRQSRKCEAALEHEIAGVRAKGREARSFGIHRDLELDASSPCVGQVEVVNFERTHRRVLFRGREIERDLISLLLGRDTELTDVGKTG